MLTDRVRHSCRAVMNAATAVRIDADGLDRITRAARREIGGPRFPAVAFDEGRAMRVLAGDAINFGSGYHDVIRKEPGLSGARTMQVRLDRHLDATGPLDERRLVGMSPFDCSRIFGQALDGGPVEELMTRFAVALNDLGAFVGSLGGSARGVLTATGSSAVALAESLTAMSYYRDVGRHRGVAVAFYKRAQITAADLARAGLWSFDDLAVLTAFADNLVPHVLRVDGVLDLEPALAAGIDAGRLLESGGTDEIELRAAAVVVVDELVDRIARPGVWALHVDQWLWQRGGRARYKSVPRPRARSVFY